MSDSGTESKLEEKTEMAEDDGRRRTGTLYTATAHAITAIIGSGVLALPWSVAQMGWIIGPFALIACAVITYFTAILLSDCYRTPDPIHGKRNHTYMDVVRSCLGNSLCKFVYLHRNRFHVELRKTCMFLRISSRLGPSDVVVCMIAQYALLWGTMIGYTITAATSMMTISRSHCFHYKGHNAQCSTSGNLYLILFGLVEVVLSQFPNLEKITIISVIAAAMSFAYSFISLFLCAFKLASNHYLQGTILGVKISTAEVSPSRKIWHAFQALGNIAFAYTYSMLLIEIQDTIKSPPPENQTMKRASFYGISVTTIFYVSVGCVGYAAFGNTAPGNVLTEFYEPFWLVDIANIAVFVHLIGAFQVYGQPIYAKYEDYLSQKWPESIFFNKQYRLPLLFWKTQSFRFTICKLILRTAFVVLTTLIAMMLPFFNSIVGLLGAIAFWPLTVYFPVSMFMAQAKIKRGRWKWTMLHLLSAVALIVSIVAAAGSIEDIMQRLRHATLFKTRL
ncbi:Amino acid permease 8 [Apostasia shenzhenica]|uniref:Amino acid permease 8 n=1 Tax=Apostasia shenzhenica TaxID=1088818 RepID=A0A2I0APG8_9ASPA|nr:Amino acid permease 8 [Apostasia shenzhenica]